MVVALVLGIAGCASLAGGGLTKDTPREAKAAAVKQRAQERWDALLKGNFEAAYAYLSPGSREATSLERYKTRFNRGIRKATVESASCEAEVCKAEIVVTFDHTLAKGLEVPVSESWIIADGQAWLVYREF